MENLEINWILYFAIALLSFGLTWLVRRLAIRESIMDIPNGRSSHTVPTPRGGGVAVAIAWFTGLTVLFVSGRVEKSLLFALLSGIPLTLIGFADDVFNLKPGVRFIIQAICAALALFFLGGLQNFLTFLPHFPALVLSTAIAWVAIVWCINLFNFLDGIDGYISTEVIFIGGAAFLLSGDSAALLLAAATLGFLFWNWQKAKIFMGDVGSTLLGFTVAVLAIYHQNRFLLSIPVWLILTSVFWYDATLTLLRRIRNREQLSVAHRKHAYQRIVQAGFSHQKTVLWALGLNLIGLLFAWLAVQFEDLSWLFLLADILLLYGVMRYVDGKKAFGEVV